MIMKDTGNGKHVTKSKLMVVVAQKGLRKELDRDIIKEFEEIWRVRDTLLIFIMEHGFMGE